MSNEKKYNVLMILSDQHHAGLLECAGHPQVKTPHLNLLAASGVRFDRAYTQNPICTPSRISILSGQYCHNHGYYGLSGPAPHRLGNLMRHFRQNGYRTGGFGKLHLPDSPRNWLADDLDRFADTYETADGVRGTSEYFQYLEKLGLRELEDSYYNQWNYGKALITQDACPSLMPYEHTQEVWSAREAMKFIDQDRSRPFCIQVSFQKPHHPLLPVERFWNLYDENIELPETFNLNPEHRPPHFQRAFSKFRGMEWDFNGAGDNFESGARRAWRGTLACISQVDDVVGMLLDYLQKSGLAENTIIVYGSDHGCYHGIHGIQEKAPGICSEAVCRVPMIWRVPGISPAGLLSSQLVENVDMTPTLASLCGLPAFDSADGIDITTLLRGRDQMLREVAVTENVWSKALRWKNWRFVHYQRRMFGGSDVGELYDIDQDPQECHNLYGQPAYRQLAEDCRRLLMEWMIDIRRTVTSQQTVKNEKYPNYYKGIRFTYPLCSDGMAPNQIQPRYRSDAHEMYL